MIVDQQWLNIANEANDDGERLAPQYARMIRSDNGMVVGRLVKIGGGGYILQLYRKGEFREVKRYSEEWPTSLLADVEREVGR